MTRRSSDREAIEAEIDRVRSLGLEERFTVEAVPAGEFEQWVATARNSGPVLDARAYADMVKPSKAVAPLTYRAVASGLFNTIQIVAT
jgi:hypothetical protein